MWQTISAIIESIPATFWGVLAGSLFTLLGVFISNRAQADRLERQLRHDRELKSEERQLALRRDVYLPAAEAVSVGLMMIGRLADVSIPQEKLVSDWIKTSPAIAKANLIAGDATNEALVRFNTELSAIMMRLFAIRIPLINERNRANSLMDKVSRCGAERDRMVELAKEMNLSGLADKSKFAAIEGNYLFNKKQVDDALLEHEKLIKESFEEEMQFTKECSFAEGQLGRLIIPLLAAVRAELKLSFNAEAYARIAQESHSKILASLDEFILQARKDIQGTPFEGR